MGKCGAGGRSGTRVAPFSPNTTRHDGLELLFSSLFFQDFAPVSCLIVSLSTNDVLAVRFPRTRHTSRPLLFSMMNLCDGKRVLVAWSDRAQTIESNCLTPTIASPQCSEHVVGVRTLMSMRIASAGHGLEHTHLNGCFWSSPPPLSVLVRLPFRAGEAKLAIGSGLDPSCPLTPVPIGADSDALQVAYATNASAANAMCARGAAFGVIQHVLSVKTRRTLIVGIICFEIIFRASSVWAFSPSPSAPGGGAESLFLPR